MLPSAKGLSFTFMLRQFTYFSPPQEANTCVNCALIPTYLHIALVILLYVDNIHEIYMLQVESNRWNLIFLCVASIPLLWFIALWVNSYARLIDACLESTIHEKSLLYDSLVDSCHIHCFDRCIHYICLHIVWSRLWWHVTPEIIFVIVYLLGTSRTKLGDADTSPTYR